VALAANDAWAVGERWKAVPAHPPTTHPNWSWTLIEHWNGSSWKVVHSPNIGPTTLIPTPKNSQARGQKEPASANALNAVAAVSRNNIWAVGEYDRALKLSKKLRKTDGVDYRSKLLSEHWDGTKWAVGRTLPTHGRVEYPPPDPFGVFATLVAAPSGDVMGLTDGILYPVGVWWLSGSSWKRDPSWTKGLLSFTDSSVMISHDDAWIFGATALKPSKNAAAHWDGNQWIRTQLPAQGGVHAAAASAPDDIWVGGSLQPLTSGGSQNVLLHYTC